MLTQAKLTEIPIPLPHPKIQNEIVEKLERFTRLDKELRQELKKELEDRKTQYTFYLNSFFSPNKKFKNKMNKNNSFKWHTLGEVGKFVRGSGLKEKIFTNFGVGYVFQQPNL